MNANDVIECYVNEVALQLPRAQRNDVAFELRALLQEELQGKAEADGRLADAAMAIELLNAFGRPETVAARYRPTLTIIDPADGIGFLRATWIGLVIIWTLGLLQHMHRPIESAWDILHLLAQWWGGTVIPSLWWPGVLVVGYGIAAWSRRTWPATRSWAPRARDHIHGGRSAMALGLVGILCGVYVLIDPTLVLDVFWGGRAAPAAYTALSYTESFRARQGPWLLALLLFNIPFFMTMLVMGRNTPLMRRIETTFSLIFCAVLTWTVLDGPVFQTTISDRTTKFFLVLVILGILFALARERYREVRPKPDVTDSI